ncbi:hypothetical protein YC2023_040479 [Brassica napus]
MIVIEFPFFLLFSFFLSQSRVFLFLLSYGERIWERHRSQNLWTHSLTHVTNSCPRHNSHIVHNKVVNSSQTIVVSCYIRGVTPPGRVFGSVHLGKKKERRIILLLDHARLEYSFKALVAILCKESSPEDRLAISGVVKAASKDCWCITERWRVSGVKFPSKDTEKRRKTLIFSKQVKRHDEN